MEEQCILRAPQHLARRLHEVCLGVKTVDGGDPQETNPGDDDNATRQNKKNQPPFLHLQPIEEPSEDLKQAATEAYQSGNIPNAAAASSSSLVSQQQQNATSNKASNAASGGSDVATATGSEDETQDQDKSTGTVRKDITYKTPEFEYFQVTIRGKEKYNAVLVDLPTIVETHRTNDHKRFYKSGNISKMLYILQPGNTDPTKELSIVDAPMRDNVLSDGLTPPTKRIVKRRFWKAHRKAQGKYSSDEINHAEKVIYEISARKNTEIARWDLMEPPSFMDYWPRSLRRFTIEYKNGIAQRATDFQPVKPIPAEDGSNFEHGSLVPFEQQAASESAAAESYHEDHTLVLPAEPEQDAPRGDDEEDHLDEIDDDMIMDSRNDIPDYEGQGQSAEEEQPTFQERDADAAVQLSATETGYVSTENTTVSYTPTTSQPEGSATQVDFASTTSADNVGTSFEITEVPASSAAAVSSTDAGLGEVADNPEVQNLRKQIQDLLNRIKERKAAKKRSKNRVLQNRFTQEIEEAQKKVDELESELRSLQGNTTATAPSSSAEACISEIELSFNVFSTVSMDQWRMESHAFLGNTMASSPGTQTKPIRHENGINDQPKVLICHSSGAMAEVYLHGATLTSYKNFRGVEMVFLSEQSKFDGESPIRGGNPLIFPQFADNGPLPKHGLVRNQLWECIELNNLKGYAKFELDPGESFHPSWPYPVRLVYTVDIGDSELTTTLEVFNKGDSAIEFEALQHMYYSLYDLHSSTFSGLCNVSYKDKTKHMNEFTEEYEVNIVQEEMDRIYCNVPLERIVKLTGVGKDGRRAGTYTAHIRAFVETEKGTGGKVQQEPDIVVWNVGEEKAKNIEDLADTEFKKYLCVEPGNVSKRTKLTPEDRCWRLVQHTSFTN